MKWISITTSSHAHTQSRTHAYRHTHTPSHACMHVAVRIASQCNLAYCKVLNHPHENQNYDWNGFFFSLFCTCILHVVEHSQACSSSSEHSSQAPLITTGSAIWTSCQQQSTVWNNSKLEVRTQCMHTVTALLYCMMYSLIHLCAILHLSYCCLPTYSTAYLASLDSTYP